MFVDHKPPFLPKDDLKKGRLSYNMAAYDLPKRALKIVRTCLSCPRCWCFLVLSGFCSHHAKSCRSMQNHALSGRIMQLRVMVLLGFSHRLLSNFPPKKGSKFCLCVLPPSTNLSVAASVCHGGASQTLSSATTGWPCNEAAGRNTYLYGIQ